MKAAPNISYLSLTLVKFPGHIIEGDTINPLKPRIDAILKLRPPSIKKKIPEFHGLPNYKYV